jgi:hypothetical protein
LKGEERTVALSMQSFGEPDFFVRSRDDIAPILGFGGNVLTRIRLQTTDILDLAGCILNEVERHVPFRARRGPNVRIL